MDNTTTTSSMNISYGNDTQVNHDLAATESMAENFTVELATSSSIMNGTTTLPVDFTESITSSDFTPDNVTTTSSWIAAIINGTTETTGIPFQFHEMDLMDNDNTTTPVKLYHPNPGLGEILVIFGVIAILLYAAAKYVGCKPSYFLCNCGDSKSSNELPSARSNQYVPRDNVFSRPEYGRTLQYAVYSRPSTASHVNSLSIADARGYGYNGEDEEEEQVKFYSRKDNGGSDAPPDYDSLVPPTYGTNFNYYTFNSAPRATTSTAPYIADSRL